MRKKEDLSIGDITFDGVNGANPDHMPQTFEKATSHSKILKIMIPLMVAVVLLTIIIVSFTLLNPSSDSDKASVGTQDQAGALPNTLEKVTRKAYFDIQIDDQEKERVVFGLFGDTVPKTVKNFAELSSGIHGTSSTTGNHLSYKGTYLTRVIKGLMVSGGDLLKTDGSVAEKPNQSIYPDEITFADENFSIPHSRPYLLGMDTAAPGDNGSRFYITFDAAPWLDGR